jgi:hypothetical protein
MGYANLPELEPNAQGFWYMVKVYVDNFMSIVIPVSWEQLRHVANAIMHGIHNVFPPDAEDSDDPILEKKLKKGKGMYETRKTLLGFNFDGKANKMQEVTHHPQRMDTHREARILRGPVWQIRIYHCKDTACVYKHPSRKGATLALQQITEAMPGLCLFTVEPICPHGAGRVLDPSPRIDSRTNLMPGVGVGLARLHRNS